MTSLTPRPPYTDAELAQLYPAHLELRQVQILARHGERTPVSARFGNAGLRAYWPYCNAVRHLRAVVLDPRSPAATGPTYQAKDGEAGSHSTASSAVGLGTFTALPWHRRLETFSRSARRRMHGNGSDYNDDDSPETASGPAGEVDGICDMGALTDLGRATTFALGQRLRHLYVNRLAFLPATFPGPSQTSSSGGSETGTRATAVTAAGFYLRSTPVPRTIESLQQMFTGLYPPETGALAGETLPPMTILTRAPPEETLYPNDSNCRRLSALARAFAQRAADRHNGGDDLAFVTSRIGKWMPPPPPHMRSANSSSTPQAVAVDSRPRVTGIMDTVNATLAHGPATRLPPEFYEPRVRRALERVASEEWFAGYRESEEYRRLGIGALLGDIVGRMVVRAEADAQAPPGSISKVICERRTKEPITFGLSACHDTTLAAVLASIGALPEGEWPPFTSHIAVELFRHRESAPNTTRSTSASATTPATKPPSEASGASNSITSTINWLSSLLGSSSPQKTGPRPIGRRPLSALSEAERAPLRGWYVRMRYNDVPVTIPACRAPGKHLELDVINGTGDDEASSFCTLETFKAVVDRFTPRDWRRECTENLGAPAFPDKPEDAGYE